MRFLTTEAKTDLENTEANSKVWKFRLVLENLRLPMIADGNLSKTASR